jgi:predicted TIM-barrel fold metal-dependent hydrolase
MPYNCHVHLFSIRNLPNAFYGFPGFARLANKPKLTAASIKALERIAPVSDNFKRLIAFAKIGMLQHQQEVFEHLRKAYEYDDNWKFIVLTMDMDHMNAGKAQENFYAQIEEIYALKKQFPKQIFGFVGFDPRNADGLHTVQHSIERKHFYGVKLYPPLGFYPFDHRMESLYAYAQEHQIPLMTHCDIGGIHYQSDEKWGILKKKNRISDAHRRPVSFCGIPEEIQQRLNDDTDYACFRYNFSNPVNYEPVLKQFPDLKICLAHAGGSIYMNHDQKNIDERKCTALGTQNWFDRVKSLLRYKNVYTDVSYTLYEHAVFDDIAALIREFPDKVLFGTDFFMTEKENPEQKLVKDFRAAISADQWEQITEHNPRRYLTSSFHQDLP